MNASHSTIIVTCASHTTPYLRREIEQLGFPVLGESHLNIETEGSLNDCIKLNLCLRNAQRVLYQIAEFPAKDAAELYNEAHNIYWETIFKEDAFLSVHSFVDNETINDNRFANVKVKDAIVDRLRNVTGKRPDSGPGNTGAVIFLHWKDNRASLSLDTSGESLSKRGYRKMPYKAPMQEVLAASCIFASAWDAESNFINPMCGSGTLAIEAALIATNRAPGLLRENFAFMHLRQFEEEEYKKLVNELESQVKDLPENMSIIASDRNYNAVEAARFNARCAGVEHLITFEQCNFEETTVPEGSGVVMLNPEYGMRMGEEEALAITYHEIGDFFKQKCKGYMGYIFTGNLNLTKKVGLAAKRRIPFFNAQIDCRLLEFEIYAGSKREPKPVGGEVGKDETMGIP
jgi:putative N6-adenine-specific DNA methylase